MYRVDVKQVQPKGHTEMTTNETSEKIAMIEEAQKKLHEAIDLVSEAISELGNSLYYERYILDHLKVMVGSDHDFLSRDANLDDVINSLREQDDDTEKEAEASEIEREAF